MYIYIKRKIVETSFTAVVFSFKLTELEMLLEIIIVLLDV